MLDPKLAKKLMENSAVRQLVVYIRQEVNRLDSVQGIDSVSPGMVALETKSRQEAIKVLLEILKPLVNSKELGMGVSGKEFTVEVDDMPQGV